MSNLVPAISRHELARSIYRDIVTGKDFYYIFAGKSFDASSTALDNRRFLSDVHKNILMVKRIVSGPEDVVYMVKRIDWTSGDSYVPYTDDAVLFNNQTGEVESFYVMTEDYNIYKCVNKQQENATSTVKPTTTSNEIEILNDGYSWKFMYQIPVIDRIQFLTQDYIPVRNMSDGVTYDVNGVIDSIKIDDAGAGYTDPYVVIQGDGFLPQTIYFNGASTTSGGKINTTENNIQYIAHTFETGDAVMYNTGNGSSFGLLNNTVYYIIKEDANHIKIAQTKTNAENNTYLLLNTSGSGLLHSFKTIGNIADVTIDIDGSISTINVINSLRGYTHAKVMMYDRQTLPADYSSTIAGSGTYTGTITVSAYDKTVTGTGTLFTQELRAGWTLVDLNGNIIGVIARDPINLVDGNTSNDDILTNNVQLELISLPEISVMNQAFTAFSGGGFSGTVILKPETSNINNQNVVINATAGALYKVDVLDGGEGYDAASVAVIGDGTGAILEIDSIEDIDENGTITNIRIIKTGKNYNYADVVISGINISNTASAKVHVGPQGGHGSNIAKELFAHVVCLSTTFTTENPDLFVDNDMRQLGVIKNLKNYNDVQDLEVGYLSEDTATATFIITVPETDYEKYHNDDELESSNGGIYKVLTKLYDSVTESYLVYLLYFNGPEALNTSSTFVNNTTQETNLTCSNVVHPEFDKNTGTIIYVNTVSPITRTNEQAETIKLFLHF